MSKAKLKREGAISAERLPQCRQNKVISKSQ